MTRKQKDDSQIIDFNQIREKKLEEKRKNNERIFFKQMLGIYSVIGQEKMRSIEILDVSEDGLSFQVNFNPNDPWPTESNQLPIRIYFSQDTYLPLHLEIVNSKSGIDRGIRVIRYGCKIDKTLTTYECYQQFVRFLKLFSELSHKDTGSVTHFYT